jgi:hypothetical protein
VGEIDDEAKPEILRAYLRRWGWETSAFFHGVRADSTDADLHRIAPMHPVFRIAPR